MTLREAVIADFREFIRISPKVPDGLRGSLRMNERIPKFLDNLVGEISNVEQKGIILDRTKIKEIVYNMTELFVLLMKKKAEEMHMSDLAKAALKQELEGDEIAQKLDAEGNADLSDEMGIIIKDRE